MCQLYIITQSSYLSLPVTTTTPCQHIIVISCGSTQHMVCDDDTVHCRLHQLTLQTVKLHQTWGTKVILASGYILVRHIPQTINHLLPINDLIW